MQQSNERGIALLTTMLVLMLISALLIGFTTVVMSDQRYRFIDRDRVQAFYAASGAMEKMTADIGNLFLKNVAPTNAQVTALTASTSQPNISGVTYVGASLPASQLVLPGSELTSDYCVSTVGPPAVNRAQMTVGSAGYTITFCGNTATNNPTTTAESTIIKSGAYEGLMALKTPYQIDITARTSTGGEVHLVRTIEAVAIPVFQFGIFSDVDLAFNAADDFSFGGRVHTNGNLYLSQGGGSTLTLSDKVTAVKEVVRQRLSNGNTITSNGDTGTVNMTKGGGAYTPLLVTQGSVVDGPTSAQNEPTWHTVSLGTYKNYIRNGRTGAKQLNLPLINPNIGGANTDLTRRPPSTEDPTSLLAGERLFNKASIRVLLSDLPTDITNIPGIDNTAPPLSLESGTYGTIPVATSPGPLPSVPTVNGSVTSGTGKTITLTAAVPTFLQVPATIYASSGTNRWRLNNCSAKTSTQLSGCTLVTDVGTTFTIPSTASICLTGSTPGVIGTNCAGSAAPLTTVTTASSPTGIGTNRTITLSTTMGFSVSSFWVGDYVVSCGGYTGSTMTNCTLPANIASGDKIQNFVSSPAGTSLLGGYVKVERLNASDSTWHDITPEILGYGIGTSSQTGSCSATDPSPNAILRLQRLADDAWTGTCLALLRSTAPLSTDYWPNTLFDTREGTLRETAPTGSNVKISGVMHYVMIDAQNLAKWFAHVAPYNTALDTGNLSKVDGSGYSIYISDRRNNRDSNSKETAEYGYEDFVNPASPTGAPNGTLDPGEDLNANTVLDVYGGFPNCNGTYNSVGPVTANGVTVTCANLPGPVPAGGFFTVLKKPTDDIIDTLTDGASPNYDGTGRAMVNRPLYFRRAIKLVRGGSLASWVTGFTVVTENPAYVQGDWNASAGFTGTHAATAVIADAVTILSNNWRDDLSFAFPYTTTGRSQRTANSYYRLAILAGKGALFTNPSGTGATFGTDGGAHSFIRMLEDNGASPDTVHYKGSLATLFYNRQAVGVFKGNGGYVYGIPALRDYTFDTDFLTPALLPPLTPMFRDMNAVGFSQQLTPNK